MISRSGKYTLVVVVANNLDSLLVVWHQNMIFNVFDTNNNTRETNKARNEDDDNDHDDDNDNDNDKDNDNNKNNKKKKNNNNNNKQ